MCGLGGELVNFVVVEMLKVFALREGQYVLVRVNNGFMILNIA